MATPSISRDQPRHGTLKSSKDDSSKISVGKNRRLALMSPTKGHGSSTARKLVSPIDSDQEQNDLEVAAVLSEVKGQYIPS